MYEGLYGTLEGRDHVGGLFYGVKMETESKGRLYVQCLLDVGDF